MQEESPFTSTTSKKQSWRSVQQTETQAIDLAIEDQGAILLAISKSYIPESPIAKGYSSNNSC